MIASVESAKILIVEDDEGVARLQQKRLERSGHSVTVVGTAESASQVILQTQVDLLLLDYRLPGNQTGLQFYQQLGASGHGLPTILVTGFSNESLVIEALRAGVRDFVTKSPEYLDYLPEAVERTLNQLRMEQRLTQSEAEAAQAHALRELAETRARLLQDLERANKELEAFSYSVSHDLRAPLRGIDGFARILVEDFASRLPEEVQQLLLSVRDCAKRMGMLIDDLLAFSRLGRQALCKETFDMNRIVRQALDELKSEREGRSVNLTVGELGMFEGDPRLLKQVWVNLISNALKFTRKRDEALIEIGRLAGSDGASVLFVKDNGSGFDMRYANRLFGVFQRLHCDNEFEGTGVGLAIVDRIIQRHGGRIWPEASPDAGAKFSFTLAQPPATAE